MKCGRSIGVAVSAWMAVATAFQPRARACTCAPRTLEEERAGAVAIFEGRVTAIESVDPSIGGGSLRVRLDVVQTWRGADREHVQVQTAGTEAACGFGFEVGRSYLVYADRSDGDVLSVGLCSRTRRIEEAEEDRAALGSGVIPVDVDDEPSQVSEHRPQTLAPRGGCATCGASGSDHAAPALAFAVLGAAVWMRRARRR